MKRHGMRLLCCVAIIVCGFILMPQAAQAEDMGDFSVTASNGGVATWNGFDNIVKLTTAGDYTVGMRAGVVSTAHRIEVTATTGPVNLTLNGINILYPYGSPISTNCETVIVLAAASQNLLSVAEPDTAAGVANHGHPLTIECEHHLEPAHICDDSCGALSIESSLYGAGIGGNGHEAGKEITINGGRISVLSASGAAIGGGFGSSGTNIAINGGIIEAESAFGAGIGGGDLKQGGAIVINAGIVRAISNHGAGIGGGGAGDGSDIIIFGGEVNAESILGAGIGGGEGGTGVNITSIGGKILAISNDGAGIGGGKDGDGINIVINGGQVMASAMDGAGIGGGKNGDSSFIFINGGEISTISVNGAGVGAGDQGSAYDTLITGGTMTATSLNANDIETGVSSAPVANNAIAGGSVNATKISGFLAGHPSAFMVFTLYDADGNLLKQQPVTTLRDADGNALIAYSDGPYGENDIFTDAEGKIYLWPKSPTAPLGVTAISNGLSLTSDAFGNMGIPYELTYDRNGGSGEMPATTVIGGTSATIQFSPSPAKTNYAFIGWDPDPAALIPAYTASGLTSFTMTDHTTLYAIYAPTYQLHYDANGGRGSVPADAGVVVGDAATVSFTPLPQRTGFNFIGWDTNPLATTATYRVNGQTTFTATEDITLYAIWERKPRSERDDDAVQETPPLQMNDITINPTGQDGASDVNGQLELNRTEGKLGDLIEITPVPNEGYHLGSLEVYDGDDNRLPLTDHNDGTYTFTMPDSAVRIDFAFVPQTPEAPTDPIGFTDVAADAWYADAVRFVAANKLMVGTAPNQFSPDMATNRAMIVTILYRLAGEPDVTGESPFNDVSATDWYAMPLIWAARHDVVAGYPDGTFKPNIAITREQLMCILHNYAQLKGYDTSGTDDLAAFIDAAAVSDYARPAMQWAVAHVMIRGLDDGTLAPDADTTRAQLAAVMQRYMETFVQ